MRWQLIQKQGKGRKMSCHPLNDNTDCLTFGSIVSYPSSKSNLSTNLSIHKCTTSCLLSCIGVQHSLCKLSPSSCAASRWMMLVHHRQSCQQLQWEKLWQLAGMGSTAEHLFTLSITQLSSLQWKQQWPFFSLCKILACRQIPSVTLSADLQ